MVDLSVGGLVAIQHNINGAGTFTGAHYGYASLTYNHAGASFTVRAKHMGTEGNLIKFALALPVAGQSETKAYWDSHLNQVTVFCSGTGGSTSDQCQDVVDAINGLPLNCPVVADVIVDGTITVAVAATALSSGDDPVTVGNSYYKFTTGNASAGLFYFDNATPWIIRGIQGQINGAVTVTVKTVSVNNILAIRGGEEATVYSATLTTNPGEFSVNDLRIPIMPGQAVAVYAAANGIVRVYANEAGKSNY